LDLWLVLVSLRIQPERGFGMNRVIRCFFQKALWTNGQHPELCVHLKLGDLVCRTFVRAILGFYLLLLTWPVIELGCQHEKSFSTPTSESD
jgi:hypothetical protein